MKSRMQAALCLTALSVLAVGLGWGVSPMWAREEPAAMQGDEQETAESPVISPSSGAERLLIIDRVMELDQAKLEEARRELEMRKSFFDSLGKQTKKLALTLEETQAQLAELGEDADPEEVSGLEKEIAELAGSVSLMATQTDLTLTAENTVRKQIESLEKKLEREQRAIDMLRGLAPEDTSVPAELTESPAAEPEVGTGLVPGMPGIPKTQTAPATKPAMSRLQSTAQVEAVREVERLEAEVARAEKAVVEFVKRKESLLQQIEFEGTLRATAESSVENLSKGLEVFGRRLQAKKEAGVGRENLQYYEDTVQAIEEMIAENQSEIERRNEYIESLQERLERTEVEEGLVVQEVDDRRAEAHKALERLYWLESPLHPKTLWRWVKTRGPRMLLVIVVAWVLLSLVRFSARRVARTVVRQGADKRSRGSNRADTLALSFRSAISLLIVVGSVLLVFQEAGVNIRTVLGGAAILGVALAFGAQNLMRDYFTGFMILLEDQYELGDLITIGAITGRVERVNMRTTMLRDLEGRVHFIPNGEIKSVTNRTYEWGRAVVEIPIGFREDVDRVMDVVQRVGEEFRSDPELGEWITDEPVMLGVDRFTELGVVIKFMVQTVPDKIFVARRELLRRIKKKFDEEGIEIAVPHRMVIQGKGHDLPT